MSTSITLRDVENWLTQSSGLPPAEEIRVIRSHLLVLAKEPSSSANRQHLLEGLHMRTSGAVEALLPRLFNVRLPISNNTRQTVKVMQDTLNTLARLGLDAVESPDSQLIKGLGTPTDLALWRIFEALRQHLTLANLIATPATQSTWLNLHRTYLATRRHRAESRKPEGAGCDLQTLYARTLIAGSLAPSALNAHEWAFLHRFIAQTKAAFRVTDSVAPSPAESTLWVSPEQDSAPTLLARRPPGDGTLAVYVDCAGILSEIKNSLSTLTPGQQSPGFLPADISPRTARIALRRLREHLASPRKRRFPRRRQGYRSTLCVGFEDICRLLKFGIESEDILSAWMIINESPGGYAAMHVSGRPRKAQVGDLVAMRREGETQWSISVVRWALSENPEHLEFGLEEISPRAFSGYLATPGHTQEGHPRALLLPAMPPLRTTDALAFSPATRPDEKRHHIFVGDGDQVGIREFWLDKQIEQSSGVDVCLIKPNTKI